MSDSDVSSKAKKVCDFFERMQLFDPKKGKDRIPYFMSTVMENQRDEKRLDKNQRAKNSVFCAIYSVHQIVKVNLISMHKLLKFGHGLAVVSGSSINKLTLETSHFVNCTAWDCVNRVKQMLK